MARHDDDQAQAPDLGASVQLENSETMEGPAGNDPLDAGYIPADRPYGLDEDGVTGAGMRDGDTLEQRLLREQDDVLVDADRSGRIVIADEGAGLETADALAAEDVGIDGGAASAEEAAMHDIGDDPVAGGQAASGGAPVEVEAPVADSPYLADPELEASLAADPESDRARDEAVRDVAEDGELLVPGTPVIDSEGPDRPVE